MKILLSAYACEPNKGSEPGVGWHWALELGYLGHDVWVLTRANNRPAIEAEQNRKNPASGGRATSALRTSPVAVSTLSRETDASWKSAVPKNGT